MLRFSVSDDANLSVEFDAEACVRALCAALDHLGGPRALAAGVAAAVASGDADARWHLVVLNVLNVALVDRGAAERRSGDLRHAKDVLLNHARLAGALVKATSGGRCLAAAVRAKAAVALLQIGRARLRTLGAVVAAPAAGAKRGDTSSAGLVAALERLATRDVHDCVHDLKNDRYLGSCVFALLSFLKDAAKAVAAQLARSLFMDGAPRPPELVERCAKDATVFPGGRERVMQREDRGAQRPVQLGRELEATAADGANLDTIWLIVGAIGVFSMQSGFAMLEVGTCASDHTKEILLKNIVDIAIGTISWWALGYALATGADAFSDTGRNGVVGTSGFFYLGNRDTTYDGKLADQASWFFALSFANTSATIVSGAIAERCKLSAYFLISCAVTSLIYPVAAHVAWDDNGRMSPYREKRLAFGCGLIDFAGSGVVHMTGGLSALVAAYFIGARNGRYTSMGNPVPMRQQSVVLQTLGTLTLWIGWFYFNAVSTLSSDRAGLAAHCCFNTILAGAASALTTVVCANYAQGYVDPSVCCNGILSGLVAITAGPMIALMYVTARTIGARQEHSCDIDCEMDGSKHGILNLLPPGTLDLTEAAADAAGAGFARPRRAPGDVELAPSLRGEEKDDPVELTDQPANLELPPRASRGRSAASLLADVRAAHARGDADALVAAVAEATDFEAWARDMRRCAALRTYAVPGSSSAHWGPERGFANLRRRSRSFSDDD
ncbi:ammonium transmembrane transporter [Aureococcus anophagefferens]|nr:ammonium transmembrane transporter [Aureococcus anophagefferens]